jgi:predicted transcriptional regulator
LRELEEIGALKTDIAKLGTCGVSYTIYGIDSDGNMVISERPVPTGQEVQLGNSENNVREFRYLYGNNYKYNIATGEFTKDGVPVTGDDMIEYAYKIGTQQVAPVKQEGVWQYYIISTGANPEVVRQNSIGRIEQLSKDEAQKVIDDEIARVAEEKRKWALEQALAEQQSNEENEPVPAIDEEGSLRFFEEENIVAPSRKPEDNQATTPQPLTPSVSAEGPAAQRGTRTFKQLWRSSDRNKLLDVLRQKDWENVPMEDMGKLKKYLEDKGMQNLDMVGTSAVDYEAWLQKLRCL